MERIRRIPSYTVIGLLAYMPFHVFLVQWLSTATGGLSAWKAAKDVIGMAVLLLTLILVYVQRKANRAYTVFLLIGTAYFALHLLTWLINPDIYRPTALLGTVYNNRLPGYLLLGMGAALLAKDRLSETNLIRLIISISTLVCLFGLLQYYLPKDLMTHFGYSVARGVKPSFFIDDKPDLPRIMSTLRDPNSLGAYLILPITLLVYKLRGRKQKLLPAGLLLLHALALLLTFSRSAWLGTVIAVGILAVTTYRDYLLVSARRYWIPIVVFIIALLGTTFVLRNEYFVQNVIVHSDKSTTAQYDSNGLHMELVKRGVKGIGDRPQGHGPGTAGLVSIQNPKGGFLTENYFIQVGYEVGLLGLIVLLALHGYAYTKLRRQNSTLPICLVASFWAYIFINLLLHIWSNEAVAAQWWLLAGVVLATNSVSTRTHRV